MQTNRRTIDPMTSLEKCSCFPTLCYVHNIISSSRLFKFNFLFSGLGNVDISYYLDPLIAITPNTRYLLYFPWQGFHTHIILDLASHSSGGVHFCVPACFRLITKKAKLIIGAHCNTFPFSTIQNCSRILSIHFLRSYQTILWTQNLKSQPRVYKDKNDLVCPKYQVFRNLSSNLVHYNLGLSQILLIHKISELFLCTPTCKFFHPCLLCCDNFLPDHKRKSGKIVTPF